MRIGVAQGIFVRDGAFFKSVKQRLVESLHADITAAFHHFLDFAHFTLEDQVGNQRRVDHDFHHGDAALGVFARQQTLRDHAFEVE